MTGAVTHVPVLLREVVAALAPRGGGLYVDCTFGRGGHARELLKLIGPVGRVLALDRDPEAVAVGERLAAGDRRLTMLKASFGELGEVTRAHGMLGKVDGVLLDLGVSSPQLDDPRRGFGFRATTLDMRMDPSTGESAAAWLARTPEDEIARVLRVYGEERHARRIARAICDARARAPIESAARLAELVARASPSHERGKHAATRTFQAIRIFINQELPLLEQALAAVPEVLRPGGRVAVISFHSLEDRVVKRFMQRRALTREQAQLPLPGAPEEGPMRALGKALRAGADEVARNPRARSAVLRVAERRA